MKIFQIICSNDNKEEALSCIPDKFKDAFFFTEKKLREFPYLYYGFEFFDEKFYFTSGFEQKLIEAKFKDSFFEAVLDIKFVNSKDSVACYDYYIDGISKYNQTAYCYKEGTIYIINKGVYKYFGKDFDIKNTIPYSFIADYLKVTDFEPFLAKKYLPFFYYLNEKIN